MNILMIEDNLASCLFFEEALVQCGYKLEYYTGTDEVLKFYDFNSYDLIFVDLMISPNSGFEVHKHIRKYSDLPIAFYTASPYNDHLKEFIKSNNKTYYLRKPIKYDELIEFVKAVTQN